MRTACRFSRTVIAGCLAIIMVLCGCGKASESQTEIDGMEAPETSAVSVAVHVLTSGTANATVRAWGTVHPYQKAEILSELTGRVAAVRVALGDEVRKGEVLLEIDPELYLARAAEAESRLESARVARNRLLKDAERAQALFDKGSISDSELEAARSRAAEAEATHAAAQASLEEAKKHLSGARLRAPFNGRVASRPPDVGSTVNVGAPLVTLVDIDHLRVETLFSEQDIPRVRVGGEASLTVSGAPGRTFSGRISAIGPQTDAETKQFPVEIEVRNPPDDPLRGGMVARVEVVHQRFEDVPLLPVDALVGDEDGYMFYTVEDGVARRRALQAGPRMGQMIGVLEGAAVGDTVVVLGHTRLEDGTPVVVQEIR